MSNLTALSATLALSIAVVSFSVAFVGFRLAIPTLRRRGIVGRDMHKPGQPLVPEMGGLILAVGFVAGMLLIVAYNTFLDRFHSINTAEILAVFSVVLIATLIGVIDDLLRLRQLVKAILPLAASLPLMAVRAGDSAMNLPFLGNVDFGIIYSVVLVPLGVTGAANAVNMLAGFNGVETGMGVIAVGSLAVIAYRLGETGALLILLAAFGSLLATLIYNWYPSKVFIGDVGTLSIGAVIASAVIVGNFEVAGIIVIIPHILEFLIKVKNRLPNSDWWLEYKDGKLFCPESGPKGLGQLIAKIAGGLKERDITLALMALEAVFGAVAIGLYW